MRFKLLRRRLTISAPSMAIRSSLPWPIKWIAIAVLLGFCSAIGLWAFEFGKNLAGIDQFDKEQLVQLNSEVSKLRDERDKAQSIANVSTVSITTERAIQEKLMQQIKQLEAENQSLRDDLGFFERLIPTTSAQPLAIRALQADIETKGKISWQVLVIQSGKNPADFKGKMDITVSGVLNGKPWSSGLAGGAMSIDIKRYKRFSGIMDVPLEAQVKLIDVKLTDNSNNAIPRATQVLKL